MAAATDTFDPWTVLGIPTDSSPAEARKAFKKLITKYHPDVDPSKEAEEKFQQIVRAEAVITGEDRKLDMSTLLRNAAENLRNDLEFKKQRIEMLEAKAAAEKESMALMEEQLAGAKVRYGKVNQELGAYGGATLGFLVGGATGAVIGAVVGLALKDREDAVGQVIRGVGTVSKGFTDALTKTVTKAVKE